MSTQKIGGALGRTIWQGPHCEKPFRKFTVNSTFAAGNIICEDVGNKGVMTLNRPKALNTLTSSMVPKILRTLQQWESEKSLVIVKGAGDKAFCAGGDLRETTLASKNKDTVAKEFCRQQYTTVHLIGTYKKPYLALIDGITMGGGVGMSVHAKYCICTEKTLFAMPEIQIGHIPDASGSYFLPRLKNHLGFYLGLCGTRLTGYDLVQAGIATHFCPSEKIPDLEKELLSSDNPESVLQNFCRQPPDTKFFLESHLEKIDKIFSSNTIEKILVKLEQDGSLWAKETLATLQKMCPLSLKISLEALRRGKNLSLSECLIMEYRLANASCDGHNLIEGVRALLIDKDENPNWIPASLSEVTPEMVEEQFNHYPYKGDLKLGPRVDPSESH